MRARLLSLILTASLASCAPAIRTVTVTPETEDYVRPAPAPGELTKGELRRFDAAWADLMAGDTVAAERELRTLASKRTGSAAVEAALGWTLLRANRHGDALQRFEAILAARPNDATALLGAGAAATAAGRPEAALGFYRRAQAVAPDDPIVRRRLPAARLQATESRIAAGRAAVESGRPRDAIDEYRAALTAAPELSGLRLEIANLLVSGGDVPAALDLLRSDDTGDVQIATRLGELLAARGELDAALEAYRTVLTRDPQNDDARRGADAVRSQLELRQMPEEYRNVLSAARLTRADLAALLSVKVTALKRARPGQPAVAVDISGSWARDHILRALSYGLIEVYPNHTFQPGAAIRRGDLARAVQGVLDALKWPLTPAPAITDMSRGNLLYYPATRATGAGLMELNASGGFEAWRPVSGEEAVRVIDALVRLVGS